MPRLTSRLQKLQATVRIQSKITDSIYWFEKIIDKYAAGVFRKQFNPLFLISNFRRIFLEIDLAILSGVNSSQNIFNHIFAAIKNSSVNYPNDRNKQSPSIYLTCSSLMSRPNSDVCVFDMTIVFLRIRKMCQWLPQLFSWLILLWEYIKQWHNGKIQKCNAKSFLLYAHTPR